MKHREIVNKLIEEELDKEIKDVKIQFDGNQFFIKIPTEMSQLLKLKKGDIARITLSIPESGSIRKSALKLQVI